MYMVTLVKILFSYLSDIWISGGIQTLIQFPLTTNTGADRNFKISFSQPYGVSNQTHFYNKHIKKFSQGLRECFIKTTKIKK